MHGQGPTSGEPRTESEALARDLEQARGMLEAALARQDARAAEALRVRWVSLERRWRGQVYRELEHLRLRSAAPGPEPAALDARLYPFGRFAPSRAGVGLCLSGGGSRAASVAMGVLRGLRHLGLLDRVAVLSTVSGGGWAGVPFTYLPPDISDDEFLGEVVPDPRDLTWCHELGGDPARALDVLLCRLLLRVPRAASVRVWQITSPGRGPRTGGSPREGLSVDYALEARSVITWDLLRSSDLETRIVFL